MMKTLTEEYKKQNIWRNWDSYIEHLPISSGDTILDLGCSTGVVTSLLAKRALQTIGIDINADLIDEAKTTNHSDKIKYINADLKSLTDKNLPLADGIWTSFTVAYFPNFRPVLDSWLNLLKPDGWIAIVEMSDLFAHYPLAENTQETFKKYYERQRTNNIYDFEMGSKIKEILTNRGLKIIFEENKSDKELAFNGTVDKQILTAWENRLDRMVTLQGFIGKANFPNVKREFLECLTNETHSCKTEVKFIIAGK